MSMAFPQKTTEDLLQSASLADFTARLYLTEPSTEHCDGYRGWSKILADSFHDDEALRWISQVNREQTDDLRQEFFDLFVVPVSAIYSPPFENVYRNGSLAIGLSDTLGELYGEAGFDPEKLHLPSYLKQLGRNDHLGIELSFYANLLYSADKESIPSDKECLIDTARQFFQKYPAQWAEPYGLALTAKARSPYFKALGALTCFISKTAV